MLQLIAGITPVPPDHTGLHEAERREITAQAASYEQARADLDGRVPEGWRVTWIRVDRPDPEAQS